MALRSALVCVFLPSKHPVQGKFSYLLWKLAPDWVYPQFCRFFVHFPPQVVLEKNIQTNSDWLFFIFLCSLCVENRKHNNSERNFSFFIFFLPFYLYCLYFYHNLWSTVVLYTPRRPFMKGKKQIRCISDIYPSQKLFAFLCYENW